MAIHAISTALPLLAGAAAVAGIGALAHATFHPRSSAFASVIWRAPANAGSKLALTFDDGPWEGSTEPILDALHAAGGTATFFIIGINAHRNPALVRRIHESGHLLANHTFDHNRAGLFRGLDYWRDQLRRTNDMIADLTGAPPAYFRPPMGFKSPPLARAAAALGLTIIAWSRRAGDGVATTPKRIVDALGPLRAGDIALLHDGRDPASRRDTSATAAAISDVLHGLQEKGLQSVRLDQLLTAPASC